uniref:Uncharacterized protein n=1 Tax=Geospiza parvula TaxID=87175 RepID=A0A8C3Q5R4_GEOPR
MRQRPEIWIAQELRRIGDEFNASYCPRRVTFPSSPPLLQRRNLVLELASLAKTVLKEFL